MADNRKANIVLVDDEEMVITSLRAFLELETDYGVHGFTDPEQAAEFLSGHAVEVVMSDYLMPRLNGIQLLTRAKQLQPEASRVLLTGHADKQSAIQAINEVNLFQYIEKPWDNAQLLLVIQSGVERANLFRALQEKMAELSTANANIRDTQRKLLQAFL